MPHRILLVEDDPIIIASLTELLTKEGYCVDTAATQEAAIRRALGGKLDGSSPYHLVLLDITLAEGSGFSVCAAIKRVAPQVPVIFLTAFDDEGNTVAGLELGADDYIPKPFNPLELVARVKAQLRRYTQYNEGAKEEGEIIDFGGLVLNRTSHECVYNEMPLTLTPIEFDILWLLCENRGKVISSEELFEKVWHEKYYKNSNNTVMVHIRHLREKMNAPTGKSDFIKTVWGVGYKVEE